MTNSPSQHQQPPMELLPSSFFMAILLLVLFTTSYPQPAMSRPHNNSTDLESLLAFKAVVADPQNILATNWTTNASFCSWIGVYCSLKRQRVVKLDLDSFSLQGTISPRIANLSFLSYLSLENNSLIGPIPHTISRLRRLKTLNLGQNYLSGPIPRNIFNMSSLINIYLSHNNLTGNLPSLIMLPQLENIYLAYNQLSGNIRSSSFARCSSIRELSLSNNEFTGTIPSGFGNMTQLSRLYLGGNGLRGKIPASLGNLSKVTELDLAFNYLDGLIPEEFGYLQHLQYLNLGVNNLNGTIPTNIFNCSELYFLQFSVNNLSGSIPASLGKSLPLLTILNMRANQFTGGLDFITSLSNCRDLEYLILSGNQIDGVLPDSVGNLSSNLQYFRIQHNLLQGKIPGGFGNLSSLILLDLEVNDITGELPSALAMLKRIQGLYLGHARISGIIPIELGLMTSLSNIFLEENLLSGAIPDSLGNISGLQILSLASNKLSSKIPDSLWSLRGLVELNLSGNALLGSVPLQIGNLKSLDTLDFSHNYLSGNITNAVGGLQMLEHLDLSNNLFHGEIPQSVGKLVSIEYLNLSYNLLSGIIPESLANLHYLYTLDLSFNKLEGQIPSGRVFSNLSIPSLIGNTALCGASQLGFSPCSSSVVTSNSKSKIYLLKYVLPPVAFIVVVLLTCFYFLPIFRSRRREVEPSSEAAPFYNLKAISYHELLRATNGFNEANLLGKGSASAVFKANLDDGSLAAVKVLNVEVLGSSRSFDVECHALSSVRHRNLIKIISTCYDSNFKALVLQFMPNGSLEKWLHSPHYHLDLLQRINVMVDVSLALEYLHHDHHQIIVHCDLKPSNVLFDEDMVGHVSDFGVSKLLLRGSTSLLSTNTPGTIGYMAPEYGSSGNVSRAADVYSFGILLLETFTSKRPSDPMFGGELSLRQWVSKAFPAAVLEVVDCNLLREELIPKQQSGFLSNAHNSLSSIINLGLLCSRDLPKERIPMRDVVHILEKIKMEYLSEVNK